MSIKHTYTDEFKELNAHLKCIAENQAAQTKYLASISLIMALYVMPRVPKDDAKSLEKHLKKVCV